VASGSPLLLKKRNFCLTLTFLLLTHIHGNATNLHQALSSSDSAQSLSQSMEWVKAHSKDRDIFLSDIAPTIYLYTGRKSWPLFWTKSERDFETKLNTEKISYVFLGGGGLAGEQGLPGLAYRQVENRVSSDQRFKFSYVDNRGAKIYKFKNP
jgi:hypothetical protein